MRKTTLLIKRIKQATGTTLVIASLALLQACGSDNRNESRTEDALERTGDAVEADTRDAARDAEASAERAGDRIEANANEAAADFRQERDEAVAKINARTRELDRKIDELRAKAKREGREVKAETNQELAELEAERRELGDDLKRAQDATSDAWQEIKKGFKRAGDRLDNRN